MQQNNTLNTHTHTHQTRNLLDIALFGPRFKTGIWELVGAAGNRLVWLALGQPQRGSGTGAASNAAQPPSHLRSGYLTASQPPWREKRQPQC